MDLSTATLSVCVCQESVIFKTDLKKKTEPFEEKEINGNGTLLTC